MLRGSIRTLIPRDADVTECPVWDGEHGLLHCVDIYGCRILTLDLATGAVTEVATPEPVASLALVDGRRLLAGLKSGTAMVDRISGSITPHGPVPEPAENRLNDGRCDPDGRFFWVGSMVEALDRAGGTLYRLGADGAAAPILRDLICSNGLAWSPDGRTMYHSDSRQRTVWAQDYDRATGATSNRRVFATMAEGVGRPDGAAVDAEGCYWSARYDGWRIVRHAPDGSEIFTLQTPLQSPTMPCFAGPDLRTLVFTSARSPQPDAGSVFAVEVEVAGLPEPRFRP